MSSQFDFVAVLETLLVASVRVLPNVVREFSLSAVYDTFIALNPLITSSWITAALIVVQFFLYVTSGSFAWNDRLWSIIPPIFALLYTSHPIISADLRTNASLDFRLSVMCSLVFAWGIRLTFNATRRGFYSFGFVDYRYEWIRTKVIKNSFLFASVYACCCTFLTVLLALITSPLYFAWVQRGSNPHFTYLDGIAASGMFLFIVLETVADNQQHKFQVEKATWYRNAGRNAGRGEKISSRKTIPLHRDIKDGFLQSGLWSWSRHPNFFAEVAIWWFFYIFSITASKRLCNWAVMGPILYTILFQVTTPLTEYISAQKYPTYKAYQARVSRLIPLPFSPISSTDRPGKTEEKKND